MAGLGKSNNGEARKGKVTNMRERETERQRDRERENLFGLESYH